MTYQELADQIKQKLQVIVGNAEVLETCAGIGEYHRAVIIKRSAMEIAKLLDSAKEPK